MNDATKQRIEDDIQNNKIFLYMKGVPESPQCGFSSQVANLLEHYKVDFASCNILEDEEIRAGIKEFSDWPTIPQLYVNGEFIGGCDIIIELHQNGELKKALGAE
jgi:monothiol glutaredoxin